MVTIDSKIEPFIINIILLAYYLHYLLIPLYSQDLYLVSLVLKTLFVGINIFLALHFGFFPFQIQILLIHFFLRIIVINKEQTTQEWKATYIESVWLNYLPHFAKLSCIMLLLFLLYPITYAFIFQQKFTIKVKKVCLYTSFSYSPTDSLL